MFEFFWNLMSFVVALGILVAIHEYGHYWVAIKNGVKVERFSIGFGRAIWRKTNKAGTEFVIALIPLGGYVKMLDERVAPVPEEDKDKAFNNKTVLQRIAIIAAGPLANFLFAIVAYYLMFLLGLPGIKPMVGQVEQGSIAAQAKIPSMLEIVSINGEKTPDWRSVNLALVGAIGEKEITVSGKAQDTTRVSEYSLDTRNWHFEPNKESAMNSLGIKPFTPKVSQALAYVGDGGPADLAGIKVGDKIIAVDGNPISDNWPAIVEKVKQSANVSLRFDIVRDGQNMSIDATPGEKLSDDIKIGYLDIAPRVAPWPEEYKITLSYGPVEAIWQGMERTWQMIVLSFKMIGKLLTGDVSVKNISGPIGIAQGAGSSAGYGLVYFLSFLALISINLGIINLLPLPVLDGGHLLYYFIELLTGKPVPERIQEVGFRIGAMVLLMLMSVAIFNDLTRLS